MADKPKFAILITTKNRRDEIAFTLEKITELIRRDDVECVVFDDGSTDGTHEYVKQHFPTVTVHRNEKSKGYIFCRNKMLNETTAEFAVSLDDDAHFLSSDPLETIESHFNANPNCGAIGFRIFWGRQAPEISQSSETPERVKGYVGCGHAWRMSAWRSIPNYPEWFQFYGEENFASLQLFKKGIEVHYLPQVFVQHRVDMQARKHNTSDFNSRFRNSLKTDWFLYLLFYPFSKVPRKIAYSLMMQFKTKIFKGKPKLVFPLAGALGDLLFNTPNIAANRNALSKQEYDQYWSLRDTPIFWKP
jgi:glycosyltransferase involved in cell wall biosynthesis